VARDTKPQEPVRKSEPAAPKVELEKKEESATKVVTPPKVDYATELFNLLCMDDSRESDFTTPAHDNGWASFQSEFLLLIIFMKEIIDT
jgi:stromal membrane-associated protein